MSVNTRASAPSSIPGDNTLRYYRLAIPVTYSAYVEDLGENYNNVLQFWRDCEEFANRMFVPLGICFDVVEDQRLVKTAYFPNEGTEKFFETLQGNGTSYTNDLIGEDSYDVGMWVYHRDIYAENSGLSAEGGVYSDIAKGSGYSKTDKWVVAHEIGHLFGAPHTTTGEGSLMDSGGDDFFSYPSIKKIRDLAVERGAGSANNAVEVSNSAPVFNNMKDSYRIPQGACIAIPVYANDADGNMLTYSAIGCSSSTVGNVIEGEGGFMPHFASLIPQTSNVIDYRPKFTADIVYDSDFYEQDGTNIPAMSAGSYDIAILVNDVPASMEYNYLTANPFYSNYAVWDATVQIVGGTAFNASMSPAKNSYSAGEQVTVSWGVNNNYFTADSRLRITMSTDYGKTFAYVLADDVPALGGSKAVTLPDINVGNIDVDFRTATRSMRGGIIRVEEIGGVAYTLTTLSPENGGGFNITGGSGAPITYTISVTAGDGGTATIGGNSSATVVAGSSVTLTATPNGGYIFDGWYSGGSFVSLQTEYTFTPTASGTYNALFEKEAGTPVTYKITATANPETAGSVTGGGTYNEGATVTLTATPNSGYEFVNWTSGGKEVTTQADYIIYNVAGDADYVANFKEEGSGSDPQPSTGLGGKWYRIKDNASGKYIDINKNGVTDQSHGNVIMSDKDEDSKRQIIYFETSGDGYKLKAATGDYIKCEQWNVSAGDANSAATLIFEETGDFYYIKWNHTYYQNNIYYFKVENAEGGDKALHPYDDAASTSIAAKWILEEVKYTISVSASEGGTAEVATGGGVGAASVEVPYDGSATLTATQASGFKFVNWTKGGTLFSEEAELTVNNIQANAEYVANFEIEESQDELTTGYYHLVSRATDRNEHLYNNAFSSGNTNHFTLQSNTMVNTNNGIWYITKNGNQLGIKNGDGKPVVAGDSYKSISGTFSNLNIHTTINDADDGYTYYYFNEALNCSKSDQAHFKVGGINFLTTWSGHSQATDNHWRFERVDTEDKNIYDVVVDCTDKDVYVTYGSEYAFNGGFFITDATITAQQLTAKKNNADAEGVTVLVEGNTIRVVDTEYVDITVSTTPAEGGSVTINGEATGTKRVVKGSSVTLTATSETNNEFTGWYNGEELVSTENPYTFTATSDINYTARFNEVSTGTVAIHITVASTDGTTVTNAVDGNVKAIINNIGQEWATDADFVVGADVELVASSDYDQKAYLFDGWYKNDVLVSKDLEIKVKATEAATYQARFFRGCVVIGEPKSNRIGYVIKITLPDGTSLGYDASNRAVVKKGTEVKINTWLSYGYETTWKDENDNIVGNEQNLVITIEKDVTYTATFEPASYDLTVRANDDNYGTVSATSGTSTGTSIKVGHNMEATITATANTGYYFVNWTKGTDVVSESATYTIPGIENVEDMVDVEYIANFLPVEAAEAGVYYRIAYDFPVEDAVARYYMQSEACGVSGKANALLMTQETGAASIFYYADSKLLSYDKGTYIKEDGNTRGLQGIGVEGGKVTINTAGETSTIAAPSYLHANETDDKTIRFVDHCGSDNGDKEHNLVIEKVESLPVTISAAEHATLYAPVALIIPDGVKAYILKEQNFTAGTYATMTSLKNGIIPPNTGVILKGAPNNYDFVILDNDDTDVDLARVEAIGNVLEGTVAATRVTKDAYILASRNGKVGLYPLAGNSYLTGGTTPTFTNNSHKAYLPVEGNFGEILKNSNGFHFIFDDDNVTDIDGVEAEETETIYDLQGRKLSEITEPGIYIVNGKKIFVK